MRHWPNNLSSLRSGRKSRHSAWELVILLVLLFNQMLLRKRWAISGRTGVQVSRISAKRQWNPSAWVTFRGGRTLCGLRGEKRSYRRIIRSSGCYPTGGAQEAFDPTGSRNFRCDKEYRLQVRQKSFYGESY
ncbi:hypothetical protein ETAA8_62640 [Anatilimnocola aggregata]|uniref:Uncharacterized protein n=1 Tax=Anatilimnocola aggregata TaxID=2528021 RepID=A0A517YLL8_9BACT|nr:hypothetical protein ETAA8_62640 [Anatilimnocola aggregata]